MGHGNEARYVVRLSFLHRLPDGLLFCQPLSSNGDKCSGQMGIIWVHILCRWYLLIISWRLQCDRTQARQVTIFWQQSMRSRINVNFAVVLVVSQQPLKCMKNNRLPDTKIIVGLSSSFADYYSSAAA